MTHPATRLSAALVLLLAVAAGGCAQSGAVADSCSERMDPTLASECKSRSRWTPEWKEASTALPAPPREADLAPIEAPRGAAGYAYFIDRKSISRGTDGVMRYTVVVQSPGGVRNSFHEGLRCLDEKVRTYAYAGSDGVFQPFASEAWRPVTFQGARGYQDYLVNVIMCDRNGYAWDADKALRALGAQYTSGGVRIERACTDLQTCGPYNRND